MPASQGGHSVRLTGLSCFSQPAGGDGSLADPFYARGVVFHFAGVYIRLGIFSAAVMVVVDALISNRIPDNMSKTTTAAPKKPSCEFAYAMITANRK